MALPDVLQPVADHAPESMLVLDFDGTISALVEHPGDAVAIEGVVDVLCELTQHLTVAFITGRPVDWIVERTTPAATHGVEFIGMHGHERLRDGAIVPHPESAKWRDHITTMHERALANAPVDVVLEPKGLGLALHFRTSRPAEAWIREFTTQAAKETGLVAHDTRYAIELRPPVDLDKGHAMHELIADYAPKAIAFFGDDLVDIPAIMAMREFPNIASAGVFVDNEAEGPPEFAAIADLVLPNPKAAVGVVADLLSALNSA